MNPVPVRLSLASVRPTRLGGGGRVARLAVEEMQRLGGGMALVFGGWTWKGISEKNLDAEKTLRQAEGLELASVRDDGVHC